MPDSRANTPDASIPGQQGQACVNLPDARFQGEHARYQQWGKQPARFPMPAFQVKTGQVDAQQKRAGVFPLPLRGFF
jgi:hypothetical protein